MPVEHSPVEATPDTTTALFNMVPHAGSSCGLQPIGPKTHRAGNPLGRMLIRPKTHWAENFFFKQEIREAFMLGAD